MPEKAAFSFDWNSIIALFAGALIAIFIDWLKSRQVEQRERREFTQIKKRIPEVIEVVKKGLAENPLATELNFFIEYKRRGDKYDVFGDKVKNIDYYCIRFGKYSKKISKELYDKESDIKDFLVNYQLARKEEYSTGKYFSSKLILSAYFLNQIQKWG